MIWELPVTLLDLQRRHGISWCLKAILFLEKLKDFLDLENDIIPSMDESVHSVRLLIRTC